MTTPRVAPSLLLCGLLLLVGCASTPPEPEPFDRCIAEWTQTIDRLKSLNTTCEHILTDLDQCIAQNQRCRAVCEQKESL